MSTGPVPPPPIPEAAPLSQGARIINTFIAPSKTFTDLKRKSGWWVPWILISVISLGFIYTMGREVGFDQISKNEIAKSPRRAEQIEKLPPDQKEQNMRIAVKFTQVFSYGAPVFILIAFLIMAGVLMGTFNLGMGASVPFKTSLGIVAYSSLPGIFHALLGIASLVAGGMSGSLDKEAFNVQNPVATNPAYFMDPVANKFLYGMVSALDVFVIWSIVLMGVGFAANSKLKRGSAIGIIFAWYLVYKLIMSGLSAI